MCRRVPTDGYGVPVHGFAPENTEKSRGNLSILSIGIRSRSSGTLFKGREVTHLVGGYLKPKNLSLTKLQTGQTGVAQMPRWDRTAGAAEETGASGPEYRSGELLVFHDSLPGTTCQGGASPKFPGNGGRLEKTL